jgi:major membrane immunogen (membrane-anchored lipoprotein)
MKHLGKKSIRRRILFFLIIFLMAAACRKENFNLKEGYFTAEAAEFDSFGWKEYLTISVSGGKIIHVEYNAYNPSGFLKSWDMDYLRTMNEANGTYPNAYTRYYAGKFLEKQGVEGIDALSGATHSYPVFIGLAEAVLKCAMEGDHSTVLVHFEAAH